MARINESVMSQWHEGNIYTMQRKISFSHINRFNQLRLSELLVLLGDIASEDYTARGFNHAALVKSGFAFLVTDYSVRITRMPQEGEIVDVRTWLREIRGVTFTRCYEIIDAQGRICVTSQSNWLVVNPESHTIIRPKNFTLFGESGVPLDAKSVEVDAIKRFKLPKNTVQIDERIVRHSDLDTNGHMNNTKYANLIIDCFDDKTLSAGVRDFHINYKHEVCRGDCITLVSAANDAGQIQHDEEGYYTIAGLVEDGSVSFGSRVRFNNR